MTYAQVGTTDTVGTSSQVGPSDWAVEGQVPGQSVSVEYTYNTLTVTWRTDDSGKEYLRQATRAAGKHHRLLRSDGDYITKDVSQLGNLLEVTPAAAEQPPLGSAMYLPDDYDEEPLDQTGKKYRITINFIREEPIPIDFSQNWTDETQGSGEWLFELHHGDVASKRVNREIRKGAQAGVGSRGLQVILSASEAAVWSESLARLDAQREREIPDGDNFVDDVTSNNRNTVSVTPPTGGERYIPADDYVVREWRAGRVNSAYWRVDVSLAETS